MTRSQRYAQTRKPLPAAARSRLAGLILHDIAPQAVVDASNTWTAEERHACRQASWRGRHFPGFVPITRRSCRRVAVHAVMLGSESSVQASGSRRTREAQGRHREVGSEGSVERTCGRGTRTGYKVWYSRGKRARNSEALHPQAGGAL